MVEASCHCGALQIAVGERPAELTACNCSPCRRLGTLWAYYRPQQVGIVQGAGATVHYVQGDRTLAVRHGATCGCITHWSSLTGADRMAVNAADGGTGGSECDGAAAGWGRDVEVHRLKIGGRRRVAGEPSIGPR